MSGVFHISEEDAARDFSALLARVRLAELVVVNCDDGAEALIRLRRPACETKPRTIAEARAILRKRAETRQLAKGTAELAAELEAVHALYNEPLDTALWD